jgi:hypothetical protein
LKIIFSLLLTLFLCSCISSSDFTKHEQSEHLVNQCYKFQKTTFVFEGRCADLNGINNNSELCNSVQAIGLGEFPDSWEAYLNNKQEVDLELFDKLAFEKQREILFMLPEKHEIKITKVVHHGWGTIGRFWAIRGNVIYNGKVFEVELPSSYLVHLKPFWLNGKSHVVPNLNEAFLKSCTA